MNAVEVTANQCVICEKLYPATTSGRSQADECCRLLAESSAGSRVVQAWQCACGKLWNRFDVANTCCRCDGCDAFTPVKAKGFDLVRLCGDCALAMRIDTAINEAIEQIAVEADGAGDGSMLVLAARLRSLVAKRMGKGDTLPSASES